METKRSEAELSISTKCGAADFKRRIDFVRFCEQFISENSIECEYRSSSISVSQSMGNKVCFCSSPAPAASSSYFCCCCCAERIHLCPPKGANKKYQSDGGRANKKSINIFCARPMCLLSEHCILSVVCWEMNYGESAAVHIQEYGFS